MKVEQSYWCLKHFIPDCKLRLTAKKLVRISVKYRKMKNVFQNLYSDIVS